MLILNLPISIRSPNLHVDDIKRAMDEITRGTNFFSSLVPMGYESFGLPFGFVCDDSPHHFYWFFFFFPF
jgi:hypothetical protein